MIEVAVVGAGHWGPNLIRNFHNRITSKVTWVVDREQERLALVRERYPGLQTTDRVEDALDDPEVDAVVVATPTVTHFRLSRAALEADKHVLVEKPMAQEVAEAETLTELAEGRGLVLMVGHVFLYNQAIQRAKSYLEQGELGKLFYISMIRTNLGPIRMDVNAAWDLAAHDLSVASYWLDAQPERVAGIGGSWINSGIEDAVFATLRYPGEIVVNLHVSWLSPRKVRQITVVGERRMLTFDDMELSEPLRLYDKRVTDRRTNAGFIDTFASFRTSIREGDIVIPKVAADEPLKAECDEFLRCVREGDRPLSDGRSGVGVVRALAALDRSMRNHGREEAV